MRRIVAEIFFKSTFRTENKFAYRRVKTTGSNDDVEALWRSVLECHTDAIVILPDCRNGMPKDRFNPAVKQYVDPFGEITAQYT